MTPARARVLEVAANGMTWMKSALAEAAGVSPGVIDGLVDAGTLITEELPAWAPPQLDLSTARARLTPEQAEAASELLANTSNGFAVTLLDGVTGSGKTEVYFEAIAAALAKGKQALVLMPEIALTSQFIARCEERFGAKPAEWHSGLISPLRGRVWRAVAENQAKLVVGARSALFLPFPDLGLIVVDEEHDAGYKQEERVTYQARDMAVVRGSLGAHPRGAELGDALDREPGQRGARPLPPRQARRSATRRRACPKSRPSTCGATRPSAANGCRRSLVEAVSETLERGEQALLFLNRRGYAPLTVCRNCGFKFECPQLLRLAGRAPLPPPARMPPLRHLRADPGDLPELRRRASLVPCGPGVERIAEEVAERFPRGAPRAPVERPDAERPRSARDLARDRGPRGRHRHRHPARRQGPSLPVAGAGRRGRRRSRPRPMPTRAPPSAPFSCSIR